MVGREGVVTKVEKKFLLFLWPKKGHYTEVLCGEARSGIKVLEGTEW